MRALERVGFESTGPSDMTEPDCVSCGTWGPHKRWANKYGHSRQGCIIFPSSLFTRVVVGFVAVRACVRACVRAINILTNIK